MTLKSSLLLTFAAITLVSASAGAYIVPGPRGPNYPQQPPLPPPPPQGGIYPGNPGGGFPPGYPGGQDDFGGPIGVGRQDKKVIYLNRRLSNETLALRQLANIGENYNGYVVQSVVVETSRGMSNGDLSLLVNGREEDRSFSSQSVVELIPRYATVLGQQIRTLQLAVRGTVHVSSITVNLVEGGRGGGIPGRPGRPGNPGRSIEVPLNVARYMMGNDRLDLSRSIDVYNLRGYRVQEILIEATPAYNTALLDVVVGGFSAGRTLQLDHYNTRQSVIPQNAVIGQGGENIVLINRGDLNIHGVTLRLSR